jgi:hypothetical protein
MSEVAILSRSVARTVQRSVPDLPDRTPSAGRTDRGITILAVAGVAALTGLGWVLSYAALRQLALSAGMAAWAAALWPLGIDLFVFVATVAAIANRRRGRPTLYAWVLAAVYSAGTVAGNIMAAGTDHVAQVVHATPAITMVLAWHLLSGFVSSAGDRPDVVSARTDDTAVGVTGESPSRAPAPQARSRGGRRRAALDEVATWVAEQAAAGQRPTGDAVAARFGVSDRTGRRMLVSVRPPSATATTI